MDIFEKITQGFRESANKPIYDAFAPDAKTVFELKGLESNWYVEETDAGLMISEPYIAKSDDGNFFEKKRYYYGEREYAQQLKLIENDPGNYMFEYPELFNEMSAERGVIQSKTKERFPALNLDKPEDITRHRLHLKMHYQQAQLDKRDTILHRIMDLQAAKKKQGLKLDLADITVNGRNSAQKLHLIINDGADIPHMQHPISL